MLDRVLNAPLGITDDLETLVRSTSAGNYMFKVDNRNRRRSGVFIVNLTRGMISLALRLYK